MPIRVGIIGLSSHEDAWTSAAHIGPLRANLSSQYTVTALSTSSPATAAAAAEKWGIPAHKAYSSAEDIAKDPDVDLVVVGVKLPAHKELALPALKAGKDVFVEWPLAIGQADIEELVQAAKEGGGRTVMGLQARCSPVIQKAKEIIDSGALGRIVSTDILGIDTFLLFVPQRYAYSRDARSGASIATIAAGHTLDAMCFLLGEFSSLTAQVKTNFPVVNVPFHDGPVTRDSPDAISIQGELESGATATFHMFSTTQAIKPSFTWTITGEKGALKFEGAFVNIQMEPPALYWQKGREQSISAFPEGVPVREVAKRQGQAIGDVWQVVEVEKAMAYGQIGEVYEAFANGEKIKGSLVDFEGAALRHRMLDACFKSSRDGTRETYRK